MINDSKTTPKIKPNVVAGPRFSGGGFNMSVSHHVVQDIPASNFIDHEADLENGYTIQEAPAVNSSHPIDEPTPIVAVVPLTSDPVQLPAPALEPVAKSITENLPAVDQMALEDLPALPDSKTEHLQVEQAHNTDPTEAIHQSDSAGPVVNE
jgi:hypothetical protein